MLLPCFGWNANRLSVAPHRFRLVPRTEFSEVTTTRYFMNHAPRLPCLGQRQRHFGSQASTPPLLATDSTCDTLPLFRISQPGLVITPRHHTRPRQHHLTASKELPGLVLNRQLGQVGKCICTAACCSSNRSGFGHFVRMSASA